MTVLIDRRRELWDSIYAALTWKQVQSMPMGATWLAKAAFAKRVTKSKTIHTLCDKLSSHDEEIRQNTTYFSGLRLPRKSQLVCELIHAHVVAVQEYDHESADEIEDYLFELAHNVQLVCGDVVPKAGA